MKSLAMTLPIRSLRAISIAWLETTHQVLPFHSYLMTAVAPEASRATAGEKIAEPLDQGYGRMITMAMTAVLVDWALTPVVAALGEKIPFSGEGGKTFSFTRLSACGSLYISLDFSRSVNIRKEDDVSFVTHT